MAEALTAIIRGATATIQLFSAASAPYCANVVTFEDIWLCISAIAFAIGAGATVVPIRQPVMAYVLEKPATVIVRASTSLLNVAMQVGFAPSYTRCSYISSD